MVLLDGAITRYKLSCKGAVAFLLMKKFTPFHEGAYQSINVKKIENKSQSYTALYSSTKQWCEVFQTVS